MPEAAAVLIVLLLVGLLFVLARVAGGSRDPAVELRELEEHLAWLEDRQRHAESGNWDEAMRGQMQAKLAAARQKHRELTARTPGRP